jgi:hypothetical protein
MRGPVKIRELRFPSRPSRRIVDRPAAGRLAENLFVEHGCVLASWSREGQGSSFGDRGGARLGAGLADLARELSVRRQELRVLPYTSLRLRVRWRSEARRRAGEAGSIEPAPAELEVRFDASGRNHPAPPPGVDPARSRRRLVDLAPSFSRSDPDHPVWLRSTPEGRFEETRGSAPFRIDINRAPWYEWTLLEGIGESRARGIVEYRDANGPFRSLDDLDRVPRMPTGWVAKAAPYLEVGSQ